MSLACDASGYPPPHIVWRREDGEDILMAGKKLNIIATLEVEAFESLMLFCCITLND